MRLEGTLDAFSLPDIFQLLSFTKKTGALHLRRSSGTAGRLQHGVVHVRGGLVIGARGDAARQELGRRLVGTGLVDDEALAQAAEELADQPEAGLARLLAEKADLEAAAAVQVAGEQIADAVFDLLRWPDGEFAFVVDEPDVDDLGAELPVDALVAEGTRRLESWPTVVEQVPAADSVLRLSPNPPAERAVTAQEWTLLALVDGRRTVADLVGLSGQGEYAVVTALAGLVGRGLLTVADRADDRLLRRHQLLSALEGVVAGLEPVAAEPTAPAAVEPAAGESTTSGSGEDLPVIPVRAEPFLPPRQPDHPERVSGVVPAQAGLTLAGGSGHGSVSGATALQPDLALAPSGLVERDPNINKSLLLRLIAGVRGL
jgi:hypothetical protein